METCRRCCRYAPEVLLVVGVASFITVGAMVSPTGTRDLDAAGHLLLVVASLALLTRRRAPLVALAISSLSVLWYQAHGYPSLITTLPALIAVYAAVSAGYRKATVVVATATLLLTGAIVSIVPDVHRPMGELTETKFLLIGWLLAGGVIAEMSRHRRAYIEQVEQRAIEAERTRDETARRHATEERLRIARDLHDSLTHSISIIKVQSGVAIHLARKNNEEVPAALLAIDQASADAVRELRATLGALRQPWGGDETHGVGLHRIPELIERTTSAGIPASVTVTGEGADDETPSLPPAVDEAAFRIVQEALTNVARHAGPATATVRIEHRTTELHVRIDDDGIGATEGATLPGVGLIGMRERVHALGGRVCAEPRVGGGFTVAATLPFAVPAAAPLDPITPGPVHRGEAIDEDCCMFPALDADRPRERFSEPAPAEAAGR